MRRLSEYRTFERLEVRQMLSAQPLPAAVSFADDETDVAPSEIAEKSDLHPFHARTTALVATLSDVNNNDLAGSIEYSSRTHAGITVTTLTINGRGLYPDDPDVALTVNGLEVVELASDHAGHINVTLSSDPAGDQLPLPANFPQLAAGDDVALYTAAGTLARGRVPLSRLSATVTDPNNPDFNATVSYSFVTVDGQMRQRFSLRISGAPPNVTLDVLVFQRGLTTVTTDARGNAMVDLSTRRDTLPADFPYILAAGEHIIIGTAEGVLMAPDSLANDFGTDQ